MSTVSTRMAEGLSRTYPGVAEFEAGTLDPEAFDPEAHVYIAWKLLEADSFAAATYRFTAALKRLTRALGMEDKYHETISWFYMSLIAERRAQQGRGDWGSFAQANPDLISNAGELLGRYYSSERLYSGLAKRQFLLPDGNQGSA